MSENIKILCFSPTGNSLAFAQKVSYRFGAGIIDITKEADRVNLKNLFEKKEAEKINVLFIVCPVYAHGIPKIVKRFLKNFSFFKFVVPCVTFGGISAGHALSDLVKLVKKRNGKILGALEISVPHIYLTVAEKTENKNSEQNDNQLSGFFDVLEKRLKNNEAFEKKINKKINPFAYIAPALRARIGVKSPKINKLYCNYCEKCAKSCPAGAIKSNLKIINSKCIRCLACVKNCSNNARKLKLRKVLKFYLNKNKRNTKKHIIY